MALLLAYLWGSRGSLSFSFYVTQDISIKFTVLIYEFLFLFGSFLGVFLGVFLGGLVCFGYHTLVSCSVFGACVLSSSVITRAKEVCS